MLKSKQLKIFYLQNENRYKHTVTTTHACIQMCIDITKIGNGSNED